METLIIWITPDVTNDPFSLTVSLPAHHSPERPTVAQAAKVRRATLSPRLHRSPACILAGPEEGFVAGEQLAEAVAALAAARAANHPLLRGPLQPARQRRAVGGEGWLGEGMGGTFHGKGGVIVLHSKLHRNSASTRRGTLEEQQVPSP